MISVLINDNAEGESAVCIVLGPDQTFRTVEGTLRYGVALEPDAAREVARRLLAFAEMVDGKQGAAN